jgi:hypothetical protein
MPAYLVTLQKVTRKNVMNEVNDVPNDSELQVT